MRCRELTGKRIGALAHDDSASGVASGARTLAYTDLQSRRRPPILAERLLCTIARGEIHLEVVFC